RLAQKALYDRLKRSTDKLTEGMDRLAESDTVCKKMLTELSGIEGKDADSLRKMTTKMQDTIKAIREFITGKKSERQGLADFPFEVTVMAQLREAEQSIGSKMVVPGAQEETMVSNAEKAIAEALQKINAFTNGKWAAYRTQAEGTKINLFKDYKPL